MVQERTKDGSLTTNGQSLVLSTGEMAQAALQVSGTWTGTLQIEGTVDGTNWFSLNSSDPATGLIATSLTANGQYVTNVGGLNAIRVRSSAAMTGTAKVAIRATLAGAGNGATGESSVFPSNYAVDDSAMVATPNIMPIGGEYRSATDTYTDGDAVVNHYDVSGNQLVSQATAIAGEDLTNNVLKVEERFSYSGILTSDTQVKASAGFLHTVVISCSDAAPTAGTIDIYDNTAASGTKVFTFDVQTTWFAPISLTFDFTMATGIYVDFTTTADVKVVCSYR